MAIKKRNQMAAVSATIAPAAVQEPKTTVSDWSVAELSALYAQERSALAGTARRMLRSDVIAEEIVQEAFLKFILAAPELDSAERALAYLRTTVNNLCLNHIRATGSRPNLVAIDSDSSVERINEISAQAHVPFDASLAAAEDAAIIREALSRLSNDQRTALVMWEMEGRSTEEIAVAIGTSPANVRHVVARARQSFARTLSEWVINEETGLTALQALSTSYKKAAEIAQKSSKVALSIIILVAAFFGFQSFKSNPALTQIAPNQQSANTAITDSTRVAGTKPSASTSVAKKPLHATTSTPNSALTPKASSATPKATVKAPKVNISPKPVIDQKSVIDQKALALLDGAAAKVSPLSYPGVNPNGVPTGFTVSDAQGLTGSISVTNKVQSVTSAGIVNKSFAVTNDSKAPYVLLDQQVTLNEKGVSYTAEPSVSVKGSLTPLETSVINTYIKRLADGTYLLTAVLVINNAVYSGTITQNIKGVDVQNVPTQIVSAIQLSSDKGSILGQAIYLATQKG